MHIVFACKGPTHTVLTVGTPEKLYYRARYYDPGTGRLLGEDPIRFEGGENFYAYSVDDPINFNDPRGLYTRNPHVPAPSPALDTFLKCMDGCGFPVNVSATTNGKHADKGHYLGSSVDITPPPGVSADTVFCCAGRCGAARGLNESVGNGGQRLPTTTGDNYHFSLVQLVPHPYTKNAIPDRPECKPGACPNKNTGSQPLGNGSGASGGFWYWLLSHFINY
jgi:hypothetical protein